MKEALNIAWDIRALVAGRAVSAAVDSLLLVSLILRVQRSGADAMANAVLMMCLAAPALLTMRWAGRVADRSDSRRVLTVSLGVQILSCLVLAAPATHVPGWALYVTCAVFQAAYSFAAPVWSALVPRIAGEEGVQRVAGAQMLASSIASPAGAAVAGVLVAIYGLAAGPLICVGLLVLVLGLARAIRTRRHVVAASLDVGADQSGIGFIWRDRVLAGVLVGTLITALVIQGVNVVEVFLVIDTLGATAAEYGFTEVAFAVGAAVASLVVSRLASDRHRVVAITFGFTGSALVCLMISQVPNFAAYMGLAAFLGLVNAIGNGAIGPLYLLRTAEAHRGAVIASLNGLLSAASILALFVGGILGGLLGPRTTFLAGGTLALPAVIIMGLLAIPATKPTDRVRAGKSSTLS